MSILERRCRHTRGLEFAFATPVVFTTGNALSVGRVTNSAACCWGPKKSNASAFPVASAKPSPSPKSANDTKVGLASTDRPPPTPMAEMVFRRRRFFIKRDDLLSVSGLTGSKARKFLSLTRAGALDGIRCIVSFGGVQSNAMRSLALFARTRGIAFVYYIHRQVPAHVRRQPTGNLHEALEAGMLLRTIPEAVYRRTFQKIEPDPRVDDSVDDEPSFAAVADTRAWVSEDLRDDYSDPEQILFVPQGGAWPPAEEGIRELAEEIIEQVSSMRKGGILDHPLKVPVLFCGAGTGTTAFYLARHLKSKVRVVAVPVAGSAEYLIQQMRWLEKATHSAAERKNESVSGKEPSDEDSSQASFSFSRVEMSESVVWPEVLRPRTRSSFADLRESKLLIFRELERASVAATLCSGRSTAYKQGRENFDGERRVETDLRFDLIYGPNAWEEIILALDERRLERDRDYFFLHTGGVEANGTMLDRFLFKKLISEEEAALLARKGSHV